MKKVLVTGCAGFIGFHVAKKLLEKKYYVFGLDNINDYYDPKLKLSRLKILQDYDNFKFYKMDLVERFDILKIFDKEKFEYVIHLAAQAGVRYSLKNPYAYIDSNIVGFINILEGCRLNKTKHLVYASSSSVYGANTKMPFSVHDNVDHPVSLYAATKKSNELMAHTYSVLYGIPTTGLRFFTVYGPWGRPDMALFKFTKAILENKPIEIYNYGNMERDFTYIDDIVEGVIRVMKKIPKPSKNWSGEKPDPGTSFCRYKIYNIGNNNPVKLIKFIQVLEQCLGKKAKKKFLPIQKGDVVKTYADVDDLCKDVRFKPSTTIDVGIKNFINWYKEYYKI